MNSVTEPREEATPAILNEDMGLLEANVEEPSFV